MVKSSMESIIRKNVDETSPWLAREKSNNSIELNGIAITELIIRLLGKSFKFDNIFPMLFRPKSINPWYDTS